MELFDWLRKELEQEEIAFGAKHSEAMERLLNKPFKGYMFTTWYYFSGDEEAKKAGFPTCCASYPINDKTEIVIGTAFDESPRKFIEKNQQNIFIVDLDTPPLIKGEWTFYLAKEYNKIRITYSPNRFKRILSNEITQDDKISHKLELSFVGENKDKIKIVLPARVKTGFLKKQGLKTDFYQGDESDYNITVEYSNERKENIVDLIIHQTNSGADFHYLQEDLKENNITKKREESDKKQNKSDPSLANKTIIKEKDNLNRPLEELEYGSNGSLHKTRHYKYFDNENITEKRTVEHNSILGYSFIHKYKNDKITEEQIFMGGKVTSRDVWIYDETGNLIRRIGYRGDNSVYKDVNF